MSAATKREKKVGWASIGGGQCCSQSLVQRSGFVTGLADQGRSLALNNQNIIAEDIYKCDKPMRQKCDYACGWFARTRGRATLVVLETKDIFILIRPSFRRESTFEMRCDGISRGMTKNFDRKAVKSASPFPQADWHRPFHSKTRTKYNDESACTHTQTPAFQNLRYSTPDNDNGVLSSSLFRIASNQSGVAPILFRHDQARSKLA